MLIMVTGTHLRGQPLDHYVVNDALHQVEMAIAVSPLNAKLLIATWNNIQADNLNSHPGWAFSTDAGVTWPFTDLLTVHGADPSVGFDHFGIAYYCYLNKDDGKIHVAHTTNLGSRWDDHRVSPITTSDDEDKPYMAIDNTGGSRDGRIYVVWKVNNGVRSSYSSDHGNSFSSPFVIYTGPTQLQLYTYKQCPMPAVGPNGELYVIYNDYTTFEIRIRKSTDGGWIIRTIASGVIVLLHTKSGLLPDLRRQVQHI